MVESRIYLSKKLREIHEILLTFILSLLIAATSITAVTAKEARSDLKFKATELVSDSEGELLAGQFLTPYGKAIVTETLKNKEILAYYIKNQRTEIGSPDSKNRYITNVVALDSSFDDAPIIAFNEVQTQRKVGYRWQKGKFSVINPFNREYKNNDWVLPASTVTTNGQVFGNYFYDDERGFQRSRIFVQKVDGSVKDVALIGWKNDGTTGLVHVSSTGKYLLIKKAGKLAAFMLQSKDDTYRKLFDLPQSGLTDIVTPPKLSPVFLGWDEDFSAIRWVSGEEEMKNRFGKDCSFSTPLFRFFASDKNQIVALCDSAHYPYWNTVGKIWNGKENVNIADIVDKSSAINDAGDTVKEVDGYSTTNDGGLILAKVLTSKDTQSLVLLVPSDG